jgi:hypothetical protein
MTKPWTVEELASVSVAPMVKWIKAIPFEEWPQQSRLEDGKLRPSMVTSLEWHGFGRMASDLIALLGYEDDWTGNVYQPMLSVVMPGHSIEPHRDQQPDYWKYRVHVPLWTNSKSFTHVGKEKHHLVVGKAYKVNTREIHSITNDGRTPRIHFMFDVK